LVGFGTTKVYSGMGADIVMESILPARKSRVTTRPGQQQKENGYQKQK
jgi:hypothetical protein